MPTLSDVNFDALYCILREKFHPSKLEEDVITRLRYKTLIREECWIWTGKINIRGYGSISWKNKTVRINRLIAYLFHDLDLSNENITANHTKDCTSNSCWRPSHIYVGTQYQNVQDQITKGTFHYGTPNLNGSPNYIHWRKK